MRLERSANSTRYFCLCIRRTHASPGGASGLATRRIDEAYRRRGHVLATAPGDPCGRLGDRLVDERIGVTTVNAASSAQALFVFEHDAIHFPAFGANGSGDESACGDIRDSPASTRIQTSPRRSSSRTGAVSGATPRHSSNARAACSTSMPRPSATARAPRASAQRQKAVDGAHSSPAPAP